MFNSLWPHGLQHARLPYPSPTPGACSNSCASSRWCHPTISFLSSPFPPASIFPSIRVFSSESALHIRWPKYWSFSFSLSSDWFPLGLTDWISSQSMRFSRVFFNITVQKHQFFSTQLSLQSNSHPYMTTRETIALTRWTFVDKVMSLLFKKPEWKVHNTWTLQAKYDNLTKAIFLIEMLDQRPCLCTIWF